MSIFMLLRSQHRARTALDQDPTERVHIHIPDKKKEKKRKRELIRVPACPVVDGPKKQLSFGRVDGAIRKSALLAPMGSEISARGAQI